MSFVGVLMRLLDDATGFQILFYRSISLTLIVLVVICIRRKANPLTFFKSIDKHDLLMGGWLVAAFTTYTFAMSLSLVASTLLIITVALFLRQLLRGIGLGKYPAW